MNEKILITHEDVAADEVTETIEHERAVKEAAERVERIGLLRRLLFSSMFYTAVVGAFGAFIGWAVLEPSFHDLTVLSGTVSATFAGKEYVHLECPDCGKTVAAEVEEGGSCRCPACQAGGQLEPGFSPLQKFRLKETDVYFAPGETRLSQKGQRKPLQSLREIPVGRPVRVKGEAVDAHALLANSVEIDPPPAPGGDPGERDLSDQVTKQWVGLLWFAVVGGMIALMIAAVEGALSFNFRRAIICGAVGGAIGFVGGLVGIFPAGMIYSLSGKVTRAVAGNAAFFDIEDFHGWPLLSQIVGRSLAWGVVGMALALGQGVAQKSKKMIVNGLIGGCLGGLFGGMLFDPIAKLSGAEGAELSRCVGFTTVGLMIGLFIGLVEELSKQAWLLMRSGPLAGKQFVVYKSVTTIGSSSMCDIFLFKDPDVSDEHGRLSRVGRTYELEDLDTPTGIIVNGSRIKRRLLQDGDRITVGTTQLEYRAREV